MSLIILGWYEAHKTILVGLGYCSNILLRAALPLFESGEDAVPFPQETWGLYRERTSAANIECGGFYAVIRVGRQFKYRFDHVFASATLCPMQAQYLHSFRELRLSNHRPLEAVFAPRCIEE